MKDWKWTILGVLALLVGCDQTEDSEHQDAMPAETTARDLQARFTLANVDRSDRVDVSGHIACADEGPWMVYAWRLSGDWRADDAGLPVGTPDIAVAANDDTHWSLPLPLGPRRFVAAVASKSGRVALSDVYGRAFPVVGALEGLQLACDRAPGRPPDDLRVVAQGTAPSAPIGEAPEERGLRLEETAMFAAQPSILRRAVARSALNADESEAYVRRQFAERLGEEELMVNMPLLLQLAQEPDAVEGFVRQIESNRAQRSPKPARVATSSVSIIEGGPNGIVGAEPLPMGVVQ